MSDQGPLIPRNREMHPDPYFPDYKTSILRSPKQALLSMESGLSEETGPTFGHSLIGALDNNLILNWSKDGTPAIGERILVHGRVLDENGRAVPNTLVEIWQANAGGRYRHKKDSYLAPLDPNFGGCGRTLTDEQGRYQFLTIRPGAYPWPNRGNDWRPMHIHFSVYGHSFGQRLITQLYFEGDPLIDRCPIAATVRNRSQLDTLVAPLDMNNSRPHDFLAYKFDIVLRGRRQTMFENKLEGM
ncbi:protocatechuate 3,4-dioxygenase subunit beta [Falsigemmobacter intermedius]|uniref:Protocatechuate 3,4-dioxygenase subunit beta n=1 Tax=Falsigemmobacter intermedius TaxID=1553448 RepID=A0A3S4XQ89_9RHOB|nr:protocatechuate 3,4-dioxygenase subunit beta [Falsigemmobacter intermedius]RWY40407.1 protocatechuate 3,4-dioxygenase subunit beta [Falsigemmobacter intermedius]